MPQHRVHGRRPRLRGAADFVADAYGSETAPAGQPSFGHLKVLPRSGVHGDRITGSVHVEPTLYLVHRSYSAQIRLGGVAVTRAYRLARMGPTWGSGGWRWHHRSPWL